MRLLSLIGQGRVDWAEFSQDKIPPYAILSHTWGTEEISFLDLMNGNGKDKAGYRKIVFCGEQAARENLRYFWVDTCCTIQVKPRRQRPALTAVHAAENGGIGH
jgi:hypothetical protein